MSNEEIFTEEEFDTYVFVSNGNVYFVPDCRILY